MGVKPTLGELKAITCYKSNYNSRTLGAGGKNVNFYIMYGIGGQRDWSSLETTK